MTINIAKDYTRIPGGRFIKEGDYSGEDFRVSLLKPKFLECLQTNQELTVVLDGGYGYATSFLEEAFGGLVRELKDERCLKIHIISDEEPILKDKIRKYMEDALRQESAN